jgi:NAD(P)-dependent dehydrogenase (short-subunit alcohol dehydrogenase family)
MITGGAAGIGRACARRFTEEGAAFIMVVDLNIRVAKQVADDIEHFYGGE